MMHIIKELEKEQAEHDAHGAFDLRRIIVEKIHVYPPSQVYARNYSGGGTRGIATGTSLLWVAGDLRKCDAPPRPYQNLS